MALACVAITDSPMVCHFSLVASPQVPGHVLTSAGTPYAIADDGPQGCRARTSQSQAVIVY